MKAFFQKIQQDIYQLQVGGFTLIENGLVLVWAIFLVVFMLSWFASGRPSWMAGLGFLLTFFLYMELPKCRPTPPVPPPAPGMAGPTSSGPMPHAPAQIQPLVPHTPTPPPSSPPPPSLPTVGPAPGPLPTLVAPGPSPSPLISPVPTNSTVPPSAAGQSLWPIVLRQPDPAAASRFEAVLVDRDGSQVLLRLYDTKTDDWLDAEIHAVASEPVMGSTVTLGGVQAIYVGSRAVP